METIINKLTAAVKAQRSSPADINLDFQRMLGRAWALMSVSQKLQLLKSKEVTEAIDASKPDDFDVQSLCLEITEWLTTLETEVAAKGYTFMVHECGYYWQTEEEASEDFHEREDAVADAFKHSQRTA